MLRNFTPELGINITCLIITAAAPTIAIGALVGTPLGLAAAFGLLAAMKYQRSADGNVRSAALMSVWLIRVFVVALEQMAYQDAFTLRASLPFGFSAMVWGWLAPVFMGALDLLAYGITAARANATAEAAENAANLARADELDNARREREAEKERAAHAQQIELARIAADAETRRAEIANAAKVEIARSENTAKADAEKAKSEAAKAKAEADRKRAELAAEANRKREENDRKDAEAARRRVEEQAEARRKEAEQRRNQQEAERKREEAERNKQAAQEAATRARIARWRDAQPDERTTMIEEAEAEVSGRTGKKATQAEIAAVIGVTDRTIRDFLNSRQLKQAA